LKKISTDCFVISLCFNPRNDGLHS